MTKLLIPDLLPNTQYAIEVRAVRATGVSEWSTRSLMTTVSDTVLPLAPVNVTWAVSGDGFSGSWDTSTLNVNAEVINIVRYEVELTAAAQTKILSVPQTTGSSVLFTLSFEQNRAMFGSPQATVGMRVRAVSNIDTKSAWTSILNASNPVPGNPTAVTATAGANQIALTWTAPADVDLIGYNVYNGATKLTTINATSFTYYTTGYVSTVLTVKALDKYNQESTGAASNAVTPTSPSVTDTTAPNTPTSLAATITNNANGVGARAAVSWVMASPPSDLAGYYVRFRRVGDTNYSVVPFTKDVLAGTIELQAAYTNYEFQINAYDWSNNTSAWSATVTATSPTNAVPANVTGLTSVAGRDSITYSWTATSDTDLKNYELTFSASPTFASGNTTYFTGSATTVTVSGLAPSTTYYARVRAVDLAGQTSAAFSATDTKATTAFPSTAITDGLAPQSSPTPSVSSGLSYLYLTWSPVTLNSSGGAQLDPVTYEVHLSTTTGFTPVTGTKVTEVMGTSALVDILPGTTTPLAYGTTYFIKLIAKDRDGAAAAGAQGSGAISKVASGDVTSIGADLIVPGTGFVNALVVATGGSLQSSNYSSATAGWKISTTGIEMNDAGSSIKADSIKAGTLGGVSGSGVIQIANGTSLVFNGGYLKSNTYTGTSQATNPSGAGFYLGNDGLRVDQGIINAAALSTGTIASSTITLGSSGIIQSSDYSGGTSGFKLDSSGLVIRTGSIAAASLQIQQGQNLIDYPYADFEFPAAYYATRFGTSGTTLTIDNTTGYFNTQSIKLSTNGGYVYFGGVGTVETVLTASAGTYIVSFYAKISAGAATIITPAFRNPGVTDFTGSNITVATGNTWARYSTTITVTGAEQRYGFWFGVGATASTMNLDGFQIERKLGSINTPSPWTLPGTTTIDGSMIRTGAIQSTGLAQIWDDTNKAFATGTNPAWSIDIGGAATFANVNVTGSIVVGTADPVESSKHIIGSASYSPGSTGWMIRGDGWVEFNQVVTGSLHGSAIESETLNVNTLMSGDLTRAINIAGTGGITTGSNGAGSPAISISPLTGLTLDPPGPSLVTIPLDGTAARFAGVAIDADSVLINNNFELRGQVNRISGGLTLSTGIDTPSAAAYLSNLLPATIQITSTSPSPLFTYDKLMDNGTTWLAIDKTVTGTTTANAIISIDKTTRAVTTVATAGTMGMSTTTATAQLLDFAKIGTNYYILVNAGGTYVINQLNSSFVYVRQFRPDIAGYRAEAIATDGTDLYVAYKSLTAGTYLHRVISIQSPTTATSNRVNLVTNPSFEVDTSLWFVSNGSNIARSATYHGAGSYSMMLTIPTSSTGWVKSARMPVTTGLSYRLTYTIFDSAGGTGLWPKVTTIEWFNSSGASIATTTQSGNSPGSVSLAANAPAGATQADVTIQPGTYGSWYIDNVMFETIISGAATTYFDGGTAGTSTTTNAWTGTANASTSTQTAGTVKIAPTNTGWTDMPHMWVGTADLGSKSIVLATNQSNQNTQVYSDATGAWQSTLSWNEGLPQTRAGISYDGTNLYAAGYNSVATQSSFFIRKLSSIKTSVMRYVTYSQYDSTSPTTHETAMSSAVASIAQAPRQYLYVLTSAPQGTGGLEEPDSIRHYIAASSSGPFYRQPDVTAATGYQVYYDTPVVGTATTVSTPDFSAVGNPGSLKSAKTDANGSVIILRGDGSGRVGPLSWDASGGGYLDKSVRDATDTGWINVGISTNGDINAPTLLNGATPYGSSFSMPRFRRIGDIVYMEGLILTIPGFDVTMFSLPAGFRPDGDIIPVGFGNGNTENHGIRVYADGRVTVGQGCNSWTSITCQFPVAGGNYTWHQIGAAGEPAFGAGWSNLGGNWQTGRFTKIGDFVYMSGIVQRTSGSNQNIFTLPSGYTNTNGTTHSPCACAAAMGGSDFGLNIGATVNSRAAGTNTGYTSLSGIKIFVGANDSKWKKFRGGGGDGWYGNGQPYGIGTWPVPAIRRDGKVIFMEGLASLGAAGSTMKLPYGYAPGGQLLMSVVNGTNRRVDFFSANIDGNNGVIQTNGPAGSVTGFTNSWVVAEADE